MTVTQPVTYKTLPSGDSGHRIICGSIGGAVVNMSIGLTLTALTLPGLTTMMMVFGGGLLFQCLCL